MSNLQVLSGLTTDRLFAPIWQLASKCELNLPALPRLTSASYGSAADGISPVTSDVGADCQAKATDSSITPAFIALTVKVPFQP